MAISFICSNTLSVFSYIAVQISLSFVLSILLHIFICKLWCKIKGSFASFVYFYLFTLQYSLFCYTFYITFIRGLFMPIYVQNLSSYAQYRYLIFLILFSVLFLFCIISYFTPKIKHVTEKYMSPYIKQEVRIILYTWNTGFIGDACVWITDKLHSSLYFRYFFFSTHFIVFYVTRLCFLGLFINFCFFSGDLRYLLYLSYISFIIWLLNFLVYYLLWFIKANLTLSNEILIISFASSNISVTRKDLMVISKLEILMKLSLA